MSFSEVMSTFLRTKCSILFQNNFSSDYIRARVMSAFVFNAKNTHLSMSTDKSSCTSTTHSVAVFCLLVICMARKLSINTDSTRETAHKIEHLMRIVFCRARTSHDYKVDENSSVCAKRKTEYQCVCKWSLILFRRRRVLPMINEPPHHLFQCSDCRTPRVD